MRIRGFRAWRPAEGLAAAIAAPPYDVVDTAEARRLAAGNPRSFLRVNRSEIDLPEGTDPHAPEVYARAAANLRAFREAGWLVREAAPSLYLYRQVLGAHAQCGLVATCHLGDYASGAIRRHEHTRAAPEADRTRHIDATDAQVGPVFLIYRDTADVDRLAGADTAVAPLCDFTAVDGVRHTVWRAADPAAYVRAFAGVPRAYIADGHHRAAGAARVAAARRAARPGTPPDAEFEWLLAVLFPASRVQILPYHRTVRDLSGLAPDAFLDAVRRAGFEVSGAAPPAPVAPGAASVYVAGRWHGLRWSVDSATDPVARLDVSVLQDRLLGPVLGIGDPRTDERVGFVGGIRGTPELQRRVDAGLAAAAFSMYPTSVADLLAVADAGRTMPPKSTWFEPKLRSGLLVHALD